MTVMLQRLINDYPMAAGHQQTNRQVIKQGPGSTAAHSMQQAAPSNQQLVFTTKDYVLLQQLACNQ
jgi:hypothetical protein